jgi:type II secretory pathway pseudopilin PulG
MTAPWRGADARRRCRAVSLLEVLTVMGVIALLMTITITLMRGGKQRAALGKARAELAALTQALEDYKRHYGDYPQTGNAAQATPIVGAAIGNSQAQALLLNALLGVYGPSNFATRINGPTLIELSKFTLEVQLTTATATTFGVAQGNPPTKQAVSNCLIDPWGNRYMYYYKAASPPNRPVANQWQAPAYLLFSVGPDGAHTAPSTATGLYTGTAQTTGNNADNLYATP